MCKSLPASPRKGRKDKHMSDIISRDKLNECIMHWYEHMGVDLHGVWNKQLAEIVKGMDEDDLALEFRFLRESINALPSAETTKKKAELKENGDWDCPDGWCDECDHHRSVEWCSLAILNHEEIDDTYKMLNEAFFEGFDAAEKRFRLLIETIEDLDKKLAEYDWTPCSDGLPSAEDCPMDCIVTRKNEFIGNFVDMAVCERDGTWTHEDWKAISYGDVESGRKTGLISTRDNEIIAWMPLIQPYREDGEL